MALEIERKFLLRDERWRERVQRSVPVRQAYLGGEGVSVRARIAGEQATLNIKQARLGRAREEFEYPVPMDDAVRLMALAQNGGIDKTRHFVEHAGHRWEIDEFHGPNEGLVVAEIELRSPDEPFERPSWLGPEVTDEERYYNVTLARRPYCDW